LALFWTEVIGDFGCYAAYRFLLLQHKRVATMAVTSTVDVVAVRLAVGAESQRLTHRRLPITDSPPNALSHHASGKLRFELGSKSWVLGICVSSSSEISDQFPVIAARYSSLALSGLNPVHLSTFLIATLSVIAPATQ
jgi:hypothetical protein